MSGKPKIPDVLLSALELFKYLGIGKGERKFLFDKVSSRYTSVKIPKRRGGTRTLKVPNDRLKTQQKKILQLLYKIFVRRRPVHGFVKGYSALTNAKEHTRRKNLLTLDLLNFFPSITTKRVFGVLVSVGLPDDTASAICMLCTLDGALPQGAPTSPILSNMVCFAMDVKLMNFANQNELKYTRFADDISFSSFVKPTSFFEGKTPSAGRVKTEEISGKLKGIVASSGFTINDEKTWFASEKTRHEVTGLVVNEFVNVPRKYIRNIRASLHKVETMGLIDAQADFDRKYNTTKKLKNVIRGRIEYLAQVRGKNFNPYRKLGTKYNELFTPKKLLPISPSLEVQRSKAVWVIEYIVDDPNGGVICSQGTAVFVKGLGLVTAYHVVENLPPAEKIRLYLPKSEVNYEATVSHKKDSVADLSILLHNVPASEFMELEPSDEMGQKMEAVVVYGFPEYDGLEDVTVKNGEIENFILQNNTKRVQVGMNLTTGMSGGPILNTRSQVIAITHKGGGSEKNLGTLISEVKKL